MNKICCDICSILTPIIFAWVTKPSTEEFFGRLLFVKYKCHAVVHLHGNSDMSDDILFERIQIYAKELIDNPKCAMFTPMDDNVMDNIAKDAINKVTGVMGSLFNKLANQLNQTDAWQYNPFYFIKKVLLNHFAHFQQMIHKLL